MTAVRLAISLSFDQVIWITANHLFTPLNVTLSHFLSKGFLSAGPWVSNASLVSYQIMRIIHWLYLILSGF